MERRNRDNGVLCDSVSEWFTPDLALQPGEEIDEKLDVGPVGGDLPNVLPANNSPLVDDEGARAGDAFLGMEHVVRLDDLPLWVRQDLEAQLQAPDRLLRRCGVVRAQSDKLGSNGLEALEMLLQLAELLAAVTSEETSIEDQHHRLAAAEGREGKGLLRGFLRPGEIRSRRADRQTLGSLGGGGHDGDAVAGDQAGDDSHPEENRGQHRGTLSEHGERDVRDWRTQLILSMLLPGYVL